MALSNVNAILDIEDEIALEGLDGITLQGLWLRLENRPDFSKGVPLDENTKYCIWMMISDDNELSFYKLPSKRPDLVIYNRYEHMDPELGIVVESSKAHPQDIYPFHKVEDEATGEMGSCLHYYTRKNVSQEVAKLDLDEVEKRYKPGELVVVASQMLREKALWVNSNVDPFNPLTLAQFCILERITRTRTMGDITQGKHGMTQLGDAKSLFYHRKRLQKLRLITKQTHIQKNLKGVSQTGSLLHHTRFYVERKSKFVLLIEHCVDLLRDAPNHTLPFNTLKESLALPDLSFKKLTKNNEFSK
ncbi:B-block binding subunit of TFIIIC [Trinorchestia longiramus]|nr:B-block binding subunit of TFIIIC [Trinorchestia longiramus]